MTVDKLMEQYDEMVRPVSLEDAIEQTEMLISELELRLEALNDDLRNKEAE